jgi:phosphoglycolate phosphatase
MIKVVAIDIDDTFYMTEEASFLLENKTLLDIGAKPFDRDIHIKTWGQPLFEVIKLRSPGVEVTTFEKAFRNNIQIFINEGRLDQFSDENVEALDSLITKGYKIAVVTSRAELELKHLMEADHHLSLRVEKFYHKDNNFFSKPDPRVFDQMLKDFKVKPNQCVYIGDSISDAVASKEAGLYFVASLESGLRSRSEFEKLKLKPDYYAGRFSDILSAINALNLSLEKS